MPVVKHLYVSTWCATMDWMLFSFRKHFIPSFSLLGFSLTPIVVLTFNVFLCLEQSLCQSDVLYGKTARKVNMKKRGVMKLSNMKYYLWKNVLACLISIVGVPQSRCSNNKGPVSSGHKLGSRNDQQSKDNRVHGNPAAWRSFPLANWWMLISSGWLLYLFIFSTC